MTNRNESKKASNTRRPSQREFRKSQREAYKLHQVKQDKYIYIYKLLYIYTTLNSIAYNYQITITTKWLNYTKYLLYVNLRISATVYIDFTNQFAPKSVKY